MNRRDQYLDDELGIFFDTETNGIPLWKEPSHLKTQPHLTQLAAKVLHIPSGDVVNSMSIIVRADDWEIPKECSDLNGITREYTLKVGVPEREALEMFLRLWNHRKRYAFNTTFDNRIIRIACKRYARGLLDDWKEGDYECQMIAARKFLGKSKNPTLEEAHAEICGDEILNHHDAMADVDATIAIFYAMRDQSLVEDLFS